MAKRSPSFLPDRFDEVEREKSYVGIYRSTRSVASLFAPVGIALGIIAVLIVGGLWFVQSSSTNLAIEDTAPPVIEGALDPVVEAPPVIEKEPMVEEVLPVTPRLIPKASLSLFLTARQPKEWQLAPGPGCPILAGLKRPRRTLIPLTSRKVLWRIVKIRIKPVLWE